MKRSDFIKGIGLADIGDMLPLNNRKAPLQYKLPGNGLELNFLNAFK